MKYVNYQTIHFLSSTLSTEFENVFILSQNKKNGWTLFVEFLVSSCLFDSGPRSLHHFGSQLTQSDFNVTTKSYIGGVSPHYLILVARERLCFCRQKYNYVLTWRLCSIGIRLQRHKSFLLLRCSYSVCAVEATIIMILT